MAVGRQLIISQIGNGLSFNGTTTTARRTIVADYDASNNFTWCGFVKIAGYPASSTAILFKVGEGFGGSGGGYEVKIDTTGQLLYANPGAVGNINTGTILSAGTWYHVALIWTTLAQLYVNGVAAGGTNSFAFNSPHGSSATIGCSWNDSSSAAFGRRLNGILDDVRFYSRALSTADLLGMYNLTYPDPVSPSSLGSHWKFDQTSGDALDSSGLNRTLTVANGSYVTGYQYIANIGNRGAAVGRSAVGARTVYPS